MPLSYLSTLTGLTALTLYHYAPHDTLSHLANLSLLRNLDLTGSKSFASGLAPIRSLAALEKICLWAWPDLERSHCEHLVAAPLLKTVIFTHASAEGMHLLRQRRPPLLVVSCD